MGREREKTLKIKNFFCIFFYFHEVLLMLEGEREKGRNEKDRLERERERDDDAWVVKQQTANILRLSTSMRTN